jgi:hypothetical protein
MANHDLKDLMSTRPLEPPKLDEIRRGWKCMRALLSFCFERCTADQCQARAQSKGVRVKWKKRFKNIRI